MKMKKNSWHAKIWLKNHQYGSTGPKALPDNTCDYFSWWIKYFLDKLWNIFLLLFGIGVVLGFIFLYFLGWYSILFNNKVPTDKDLKFAAYGMWVVINFLLLCGLLGWLFKSTKKEDIILFKKHIVAKLKRQPFCFKINWEE